MKRGLTFDDFINENESSPIEIVYYSEVIDNWGRTESSQKPNLIKDILKDEAAWTDDLTFEDKQGNVYYVDDLVGKQVKVGNEVFTIKETE